MNKKMFEELKAGLGEAIAHASGQKTAGRLRRVYIPSIDVARVREKLGLSQDDFADAFDRTKPTVIKFAHSQGQSQTPRMLVVPEAANTKL